MIKRLVTFILVLNLAILIPVFGQTAGETDKVRESARKLSLDSSNTVEVILRAGGKRKGRITSVLDDSFVLENKDSGDSTTISFADVKEIKKHRKGVGISKGTWIAIGAGAAVAVIAGLILGRRICNEQVC